jgi:NAD(P)-dependent dehydrogenase (short-subunit alcohol dehydrogenase family)
MSTTQRLSGKSALFAGGSRSIGAEIAQRHAADGSVVVLACLDETKNT